MGSKVYKSSIFDRCVYSLMSVEIILPSLWAILYGIDKRTYDWPMIPAGALVCSYMIYVLQKFFTLKVILSEDSINICNMDNVTTIRYEDIIALDEKRNACYIIDSVEHEGRMSIRGAGIDVDAAQSMENISVDIKKVPVLQKAFIEDYDELVEGLFERCNKDRKVRKGKLRGKELFVRTAALRSQMGIKDIFGVIFPYILLAIIFLMGLVEFAVAEKGHLSSVMTVYIKLIFPMFVVISLFALALKYIGYMKSLMRNDAEKEGISGKGAVTFLIFSILVSAGIIIIFFTILKRIKI